MYASIETRLEMRWMHVRTWVFFHCTCACEHVSKLCILNTCCTNIHMYTYVHEYLPPLSCFGCSVTEACPPTPSNAYTTSQAYVLFYHKKAWHTHTRACMQMRGTKRALIYIVHMCMFPIVFLYSLHNDMLAPKPTKSGTFSMTCTYLYVYYIYTLVCVCVYLYTHMYV